MIDVILKTSQIWLIFWMVVEYSMHKCIRYSILQVLKKPLKFLWPCSNPVLHSGFKVCLWIRLLC